MDVVFLADQPGVLQGSPAREGVAAETEERRVDEGEEHVAHLDDWGGPYWGFCY